MTPLAALLRSLPPPLSVGLEVRVKARFVAPDKHLYLHAAAYHGYNEISKYKQSPAHARQDTSDIQNYASEKFPSCKCSIASRPQSEAQDPEYEVRLIGDWVLEAIQQEGILSLEQRQGTEQEHT